MKQPNLLKEILQNKGKEVEARKKKLPLEELKKDLDKFPLRNFEEAISSKQKPINLIAEIKKASPSEGVLREKFDLQEIVAVYSRHAQAISVLTDEKYFQGKMEYLRQVKEATALPVLQKDFIIDEYQLFEARAAGADAILLIAAALAKEKLKKLHSIAAGIGLHCMVEAHSYADIEKVLNAQAEIIGINNRDLATLKVDLRTTLGLRSALPAEKTIVSESGFNSAKDIAIVKGKVDAVLIGSALMKAQDIEAKLFELGF
jgi:indole-3-glycerol phosphate synthase